MYRIKLNEIFGFGPKETLQIANYLKKKIISDVFVDWTEIGEPSYGFNIPGMLY